MRRIMRQGKLETFESLEVAGECGKTSVKMQWHCIINGVSWAKLPGRWSSLRMNRPEIAVGALVASPGFGTEFLLGYSLHPPLK